MARRLPELDGLRGIAILSVVLWHYFVGPTGGTSLPSFLDPLRAIGSFGWSGVDLFFILSGFLIGGILIDARGSEGYFRFFYARRALRILPIYVALCAVYAVAWSASAWIDRPSLVAAVGYPMPWWFYATFTQNFYVASHGW